jgi:hypothetical protein
MNGPRCSRPWSPMQHGRPSCLGERAGRRVDVRRGAALGDGGDAEARLRAAIAVLLSVTLRCRPLVPAVQPSRSTSSPSSVVPLAGETPARPRHRASRAPAFSTGWPLAAEVISLQMGLSLGAGAGLAEPDRRHGGRRPVARVQFALAVYLDRRRSPDRCSPASRARFARHSRRVSRWTSLEPADAIRGSRSAAASSAWAVQVAAPVMVALLLANLALAIVVQSCRAAAQHHDARRAGHRRRWPGRDRRHASRWPSSGRVSEGHSASASDWAGRSCSLHRRRRGSAWPTPNRHRRRPSSATQRRRRPGDGGRPRARGAQELSAAIVLLAGATAHRWPGRRLGPGCGTRSPSSARTASTWLVAAPDARRGRRGRARCAPGDLGPRCSALAPFLASRAGPDGAGDQCPPGSRRPLAPSRWTPQLSPHRRRLPGSSRLLSASQALFTPGQGRSSSSLVIGYVTWLALLRRLAGIERL